MAIAANAQSPESNAQIIDHMLEVAIAEWSDLAGIEQEFGEMDSLEQMEFLAEWNKAEEREVMLALLKGYMSPEQGTIYQSLLALISKYQEVMDNIKTMSGYRGKFSANYLEAKAGIKL